MTYIVKEMPEMERPREKALKYGVSCLSNRELLAILIRNGYHQHSSLAIADDLLILSDGLSKLDILNYNELTKLKGIKKVKAIELLACFELAKRLSEHRSELKDSIQSPDDLYSWLIIKLKGLQQEHFYVIFLDTKNHIITYQLIFKGTVNTSIVHPREIFKEAINHCASKIIIVHNHPSGDLTPSQPDIEVTKVIKKIGKIMEIPLVDHIIISDCGYFSFLKHQMI
ncbi:MAG: DNA repair protein RadC [Erysipelotrichaceae bacterium]